MGYHVREIQKGTYGKTSKIAEELDELLDAEQQGDKIMMLCELADIIGACGGVAKTLGVTLDDVVAFSRKTTTAFEDGSRAPSWQDEKSDEGYVYGDRVVNLPADPAEITQIMNAAMCVSFEQRTDELLGKTEAEARSICEAAGYSSRVVSVDGKGMRITMDLRLDRMNLYLFNGIVTKTNKG
jgi:phosphoribosyl-ATP pyrophosphohydrolase